MTLCVCGITRACLLVVRMRRFELIFPGKEAGPREGEFCIPGRRLKSQGAEQIESCAISKKGGASLSRNHNKYHTFKIDSQSRKSVDNRCAQGQEGGFVLCM
jgi:hypothetical protein